MSKKILVTGGTGFVGSHVIDELLAHGYEVRALVRAGKVTHRLEVEHVVGELTDSASLEAAVQGTDGVIHLAALYREAKFADQVYFDVNFEGTKRLVAAAAKEGVKRFIFCSTTGVMGNISQPPADETHSYNPDDVYQQSKTEAEKFMLEAFRQGIVSGLVIRPTMIWGPRDRRFLKMFKGIQKGLFPILGDGKTLNHYVLVTDLARGFRLALEADTESGEVILVGGRSIVTLEQAVEAIAKELKVAPFPFKIPAWPVQLLGSLVEALCRPFGIEPPLHRRRVDFFVKSRAFSCEKAKRLLGYEAAHSFEDEVAILVAWYREAGWL